MTTALIITGFTVAIVLIGVLSGYVLYLKNEIDHWYNMYSKEEERCRQWQERCNELVDSHQISLEDHEKTYMDLFKRLNDLIDENISKNDQLEDIKSKYDALNESLNDRLIENTTTKITSLDNLFNEDIEELDFPNSHNEED